MDANKLKRSFWLVLTIAIVLEKGADLIPVWFLGKDGQATIQRRLLDEENPPKLKDENFPVTSTNFYRSDDVSATAYFYLDKPENNLPELPPIELRMKDLEKRVFSVIGSKSGT